MGHRSTTGNRIRMGMRASHGPAGRLSPAALTVLAAASGGAILLWVVPGGLETAFAPTVILPVLSAAIAGAATWFVARRGLSRTHADMETLHEQLRRCREELDEKKRAAKAHAAVARLMGAAVARLAEGDLSARVSLDLPEPYRAFRDDFNAAAEALEAAATTVEDARGRLRRHGQEIGEAAGQLMRRARKLEERIDADLAAMEAGAARRMEEALRLAQYTMGGVRIATGRNIEAATRFAELGRLMADEAENLPSRAGEHEDEAPEQQTSAPMPRVAFPIYGATALKPVDTAE